jgi:hypothetical protein
MNDVTALVLAIPSTVDIILSKNTVYYAIQTGGYGFFYKSSFSQNISSTY